MIIYNRTEYKALSLRSYTKEKKVIVELLKLQEWVIKNDKRVAVVMEEEMRSKGSTIKRFIENMMPKAMNVIVGCSIRRTEQSLV